MEVILTATLVFSWLVYLWDEYLARRQIKLIKSSRVVPVEVESVYDQKTFDKAKPYQLEKNQFSCWHGLFSQVLLTIILLLYVLPYSWRLAEQLAMYFGLGQEYETSSISISIIWMFLVSLFNIVTDLPWVVYSVFVIEDRHGFNKQTPGFFVKDQLKKFIVSQCIAFPVIAALIYIISWGGNYFFVYAWIFCCTVILVFMTIYPDFIAPIFDKFTPLPDGELRTAIEKLAQNLAFPLTKLYVVENSKRSTHSNAYFYGFYNNKRIVLFDTLLEKGVVPELDSKQDEKREEKTSDDNKPSQTDEDCEDKPEISGGEEGNPDEEPVDSKPEKSESCEGKSTANKRIGCNTDEILAVLSHELGHWKFNHVLKHIVIAQVNLFASFAAFAVLVNQKPLFEAFGFSADMQPIIIRLIIIFQFVFQPYNEVLSFLMIQLTRRFEFQADRFTQQLDRAESLQSALVKINKENLGFPIADPLYAAFHHSHPSLVERLRALGGRDKRD